VGLAVLDSNVYQLGIFWLLGCDENEGGVGCGILRLVFADSCGISVSWVREKGIEDELKSRAII
jgi:hypothetical protein